MPEDFVQCRICGRQFKEITGTHLRSHHFTVPQYKSQFPDADTLSRDTLRRMKLMKPPNYTPEVLAKMSSRRRAYLATHPEARLEAFDRMKHAKELWANPDLRFQTDVRPGSRLELSDGNGNTQTFLVVKRTREYPEVRFADGALYVDRTVVPPKSPENLKTLLTRWASANGFSLQSLNYRFVG